MKEMQKYIEDRVTPEPNSGCWLWMQSCNPYGQAKFGGEQMGAHRMSFKAFNGYLPEVVMHSCDTPQCCNPVHLRAGTHELNVADRHNKGRSRNGTSQGSKRPCAKPTEGDIPKILNSHASGESMHGLARRFAVGYTTIRSIIQGRAWMHVPRTASASAVGAACLPSSCSVVAGDNAWENL